MTDQEVEFTIADNGESEKSTKVDILQNILKEAGKDLPEHDHKLLAEAIHAGMNDDLDQDPDEADFDNDDE